MLSKGTSDFEVQLKSSGANFATNKNLYDSSSLEQFSSSAPEDLLLSFNYFFKCSSPVAEREERQNEVSMKEERCMSLLLYKSKGRENGSFNPD